MKVKRKTVVATVRYQESAKSKISKESFMSNILTESLEDYLLDIYIVNIRKKIIRLKDIAKRRGVKLPSAVNAIKSLAQKGFIAHESYGYIELTDFGIEQAKRLYERHKTIYKFFHNILGLDEILSEKEAHKTEHDLHEKTLNLLLKFTEFVEKAPVDDKPRWLKHFAYFVETGKFPECINEGGKEKVYEKTLNELKVGDQGKIIRIGGDSEGLKRRLLDMGVIPGNKVRVEKVAPLGDPIDIFVKNYHLSLRKNEAAQIVVEEI